MTDTVTRLLELADDYHHSFDSENINGRIDRARKALHDELVRMFTPLSDEQIESVNKVWINYTSFEEFEVHQPSVYEFARAIEKQHGIGGES